uniref:GCR069 n=1 Tax=Schmidtea mediterranea TaxID=79327 RepID=A0A193KU95_SCHMD|nr:GCR069 [Schmidtea mediterranea]
MNISNALDQGKGLFSISVIVSVIYCAISTAGIFGNLLVIYVILKERKMRILPTNIFILNMAMADLVIMLVGVEEIVHHILDKGWLLGSVACKILRYGMTTCLYVSVLTLIAVCIERYIAIIYPIKAHIWCNKKHTLIVLITIWIAAILCGLPTVIFVQAFVPPMSNSKEITNYSIIRCMRVFSMNRKVHYKILLIVQYVEFFLYYFIPILTQIILYTKIYQALFRDIEINHLQISTRNAFRNRAWDKSFREEGKSRFSETELINVNTIYEEYSSVQNRPAKPQSMLHLRRNTSSINTRKQVVKMLIACVSTYFFCYSPIMVPLFYSSIAKSSFHPNQWFHVIIMTLAYSNSAANPILYSIFSQRFRTKFKHALQCW